MNETTATNTAHKANISAWLDREAAIKQYMPLVKYVVRRMALKGAVGPIDTEDLISHGNIGLIQAIDRYDPSIGIKFEAYAVTRIRGAIIDAIRSVDGLPRGLRQRARHIEETRNALMFELGRTPSTREVQESAGLTGDQYTEAVKAASLSTISLDEPYDGAEADDNMQVSQAIADPNAEDMSAPIEKRELIEALAGAVKNLPPRELLVVSLHYEKGMAFKDIAEILNVSAGRAGQLHAQAIGRLQRWLSREAA